MKQWVQKLIDQLEFNSNAPHAKKINGAKAPAPAAADLTEERATLLFLLDTFNKHLFEIEGHPVRKVRETLDMYAKELVHPEGHKIEDVLFKIRQFFSSYRIDEYTYMQKTFEDFRHIIWEFVNQLSEDLSDERKEDVIVKSSLEHLKEAVESNSIDKLRSQSKQFIDCYVNTQTKKEHRKAKRMEGVKKNLDTVKKQLHDAHSSLKKDHLTNAHNRKSFDEELRNQMNMHTISNHPVTLIMLDIDHFKKINDSYGHPMGDFILQECVRILKELFPRDVDFVARIGGEEFAVVLPHYSTEHAVHKAEAALHRIRHETYIKDNLKVNFTVSMGIAQLQDGEDVETWIKRADQALYNSKNTGRNRYTVAAPTLLKTVA